MPDRTFRGRFLGSTRAGAGLRRAAVGVGLLGVVAVTAFWTDRVSSDDLAGAGPEYTVLQMNLCLSGRAACFPDVQYPLGVEDAVARITQTDPDAVTLDEVCESDVELIAHRTGYHARFSAVSSQGFPVVCQDPDDRGSYGIAVLTKASITSSVNRPYDAQDSVEQRRWICVGTNHATVCATHLDIRGGSQLDAVNDAQCAEFAHVLEAFTADRPLVAGGDMNRTEACAPQGMWVKTDAEATQTAGKQHVYGTADLHDPVARVIPLSYTDHDGLVVDSRISR